LKTLATNIENCLVVEMPRHLDNRGFFQEVYSHKWAYTMPMYTSAAGYIDWKQINWSSSEANVIRGIHVAPYYKFITCVNGHIFDVVFDLRPNSRSYLQWFGIYLKADEPKSLLIPAGCGHGFAAIQPSTAIYLQSDVFAAGQEVSIKYDSFGVTWPVANPIVSEKDLAAKPWKEVIQVQNPQTELPLPRGQIWPQTPN
jgi:dTDP-4-dehydrorhamnose 3,5-epimerase